MTISSETAVNRRPLPIREIVIGAALYFVALTAIAVQIGSRPGFAYNWENYTLYQGFAWWASPTIDAFDLTDGLMSDSGRLWTVLVPAWVAFRFVDESVGSLRFATGRDRSVQRPADLAPVPATDARTRGDARLVGLRSCFAAAGRALGRVDRRSAPAAMASWLLYARTATVVGLSVTIALLTILMIDQVRRLDRYWWIWLFGLQAMLLIGAWSYAPIRFLYPFALVYFVVECLFRRNRWREWVVILVGTAVMLPVLLTTIDQDPEWNPVDSISGYYNARGEQLLALRDDPRGFQYYLRDADMEQSPEELERQLIEQNTRDLVRLFFDIDTKPAITDFWNQTGRLMPWFMTPLVLLGMGTTLLRVFRSPEARLLHLMFWGFTLPMILTSKVHIGRLVFAMPMLAIFAAIGVAGIAWGLTFHLDKRLNRRPLLNLVAPLLGLTLIVAVALSSFADYRVSIALSMEARFADLLASDPQQFEEGVVWIGVGREQLEVESISLAAAQIEVNSDYQFINLALGESVDPNDPRPPVYFGGVTDLLADPVTAEPLCALPWVMRGDRDPLADVTTACVSDSIHRIG